MQLYIGNKNYSSWSMRPWLLMKVLGIDFDETVVPLYVEGSAQRIKEFSPSGKVPCLVDGDITVWESLAIIEYLAGKLPDKGIWPNDPAARAHARAIASEMHAGFQPLRQACPMSITQRFQPKALPPNVLANVERIEQIWREARDRFADKAAGPFLYGAYSAADAMFAPIVSRLHSYGIDVGETTRAYMAAQMALPAWSEWVTAAARESWVLPQNEHDTVIEDMRARR